MDFPIQDLMDENACPQYLRDVLHPEGLHCRRCQAREGFQVHRSFREPVLDYRCPACGRVFKASFTDLSDPRTETTSPKTEARDQGLAPGSIAVGEVVEVRADPVLLGGVVAIKGAGDVVGRLPVASRLHCFRLEGLAPSRFALLLGLGKCEVRIGANCTEYQGLLGKPPNILGQEGTRGPRYASGHLECVEVEPVGPGESGEIGARGGPFVSR